MDLMKLAIEVESQVNNSAISAEGFNLKQAILLSVADGEYGVTLHTPIRCGDVYELLNDDKALAIAQRSHYVAVVTCGWASPISDDGNDDEVAPSQHPKRRRVRLVVLASRSAVASVLRFSDDADEIVPDAGQARGSLADAIHDLMKQAGGSLN